MSSNVRREMYICNGQTRHQTLSAVVTIDCAPIMSSPRMVDETMTATDAHLQQHKHPSTARIAVLTGD
jgi:hypothetical protein